MRVESLSLRIITKSGCKQLAISADDVSVECFRMSEELEIEDLVEAQITHFKIRLHDGNNTVWEWPV